MKCPLCGQAELVHTTRPETYTYKGETTVVADVTGDYCSACEELITDAPETERVMSECSRSISK